MTEKEREYQSLKDHCYSKALEALLHYGRLCDNVLYDEEHIEIEVNGMLITIKNCALQ